MNYTGLAQIDGIKIEIPEGWTWIVAENDFYSALESSNLSKNSIRISPKSDIHITIIPDIYDVVSRLCHRDGAEIKSARFLIDEIVRTNLIPNTQQIEIGEFYGVSYESGSESNNFPENGFVSTYLLSYHEEERIMEIRAIFLPPYKEEKCSDSDKFLVFEEIENILRRIREI